ncbi:MAG: hypothetical protein C0601_08335 [Candidatus Muiribacterium halophilum]|uniref:GGDEF domain-containing protein n=1 Tax=Muiribacterium halophilum TaxID=2053465 RepID=A0A2N5ZEN5_MUIH1|nr:MAG: hypothetical protein C0601_08335 [Candidatus Muirbacterium halophilum]
MKKFFLFLFIFISILGVFYATSPEIWKLEITKKIDSFYNEMIVIHKADVLNQLYTSGDPDLVNIDAMVNGNEAAITMGMTDLSAKVKNKKEYESLLKLKVISIIKDYIYDAKLIKDIEVFKYSTSFIEFKSIIVFVSSYFALLSVVLAASIWGVLGGLLVGIILSLIWVFCSFYFIGSITGTEMIYEYFVQISISGLETGVDFVYAISKDIIFKNLLVLSGIITLFGLIIGKLFQNLKTGYLLTIRKLESDDKQKQAEISRLKAAESKFSKSGDKVRKLSDRFVALQSTVRVLGSSTKDKESAMGEVISTTKKVFGCKKCAIFLYDKEEGTLIPEKYSGYAINEINAMAINMKDQSESFIKEVVKAKMPVSTIETAKKDFKLKELLKKETIKVAMVAPLINDDKILGAMIVGDVDNESEISDYGRMMVTLATLTSMTLTNAALHAKTVELANTDGMTKLYNNRYFSETTASMLKAALKTGEKISMLMTDIDHFKNFNDVYGHQIGDFVLENTAKILKNHARKKDLAARYGGEEFALIMPKTDTAEAVKIAEELRIKIETKKYEVKGLDKPLSVTISIGVSTFPDHARDLKTLVKVADDGLYMAKEGGRNVVKCAGKNTAPTAPAASAPADNAAPTGNSAEAKSPEAPTSTEDDIFKF